MRRGVISGVLLPFFSIFLVVGCSSMDVENFAGKEPELQLEKYFDGETKAWGIFEDRFGNLRRQFTVNITGSWNGKKLVLDEHFEYSDGEVERRVWKITKEDQHNYVGTADDVFGIAKGKVFGNAFQWGYDVNLKFSGRLWRVSFEDWMFLQPGGVLVNKAKVSKWGIHLGTVTLFFLKSKETAKT